MEILKIVALAFMLAQAQEVDQQPKVAPPPQIQIHLKQRDFTPNPIEIHFKHRICSGN